MTASPTKVATRHRNRLPRLSVLGVAVASLVGGFTLLVGAAPAGAATNLYVSPAGTDVANGCLSQANPCQSLRHAYAVSSAGNVINLAPGTYIGGIDITHNLHVVGYEPTGSLDATNVTIEGGGGTTIYPFVLEADANTVSISNLVVTGSEIASNGRGGGIFVTGAGNTLNLTNVSVVNNQASFFDGVGILNQGTLNMTGGIISGNTGSDTALGEVGGGFYNGLGRNATLQNVSFNHDTMMTSSGEGGGIFNNGHLKLVGTIAIHNNSAAVDGGGIEACSDGTITHGPATTVSVTANTPNNISSADPEGICS